MPRKRKHNYEADLRERLRDPAFAAAYLNAVLEDEEEGADEVFLLALRDVAAAHKMSRLAGQAGVNRENMYRMLSRRGNPRLKSLLALLKAMKLQISVRAVDPPDGLAQSEAVAVGQPTEGYNLEQAISPMVSTGVYEPPESRTEGILDVHEFPPVVIAWIAGEEAFAYNA